MIKKKLTKLQSLQKMWVNVLDSVETDRLLEMRTSYIGRLVYSNTVMETDTLRQMISNVEYVLRKRGVSYE